jgi:nickel-dependent lactate racemase
MVEIGLAYGRSAVKVEVPELNLVGVVLPSDEVRAAGEISLVREALEKPIGTARLRDMVQPGQKVAIVTSDLTRPCPSDRLLPPILDELGTAGVPDDNVQVILALGLHRPMTAAEMEASVGAEVYRRVQVMNHDPDDTVRLGITTAGTPVEIFRPLVEADARICIGNLELHYFAGYSGGAKAILPGCASRATVNANHAMMVLPEAGAGRLAGNPVRADIEEGAALLGVDFILNVVVDGEHCIAAAVAGDVRAAHQSGCEVVAQRGIVEIEQAADIVLVSAGGYPKDVNLYQAQKALDNAAYAVREGGVLILVAECPEGFGNTVCETWLTEAQSPDQVLERIQREFVLGGHKAAAISAVQKRARVYLVSDLAEDLVRRCRMTPFRSPEQAMDAAFEAMGREARLLVLPQGGSILPLPGKRSGDERTKQS